MFSLLTLKRPETQIHNKTPSAIIRFQTKTGLFCYRPHYHAENYHWKRAIRKRSPEWSDLKTMLFWKRCFLVGTEETMLSENGDTTGRQTTRPWLSKMADRRYHVASISRQFRGPIYWNAHASSSFEHAHWGYKSVFKTDTALYCGRAKTIRKR